MTCTTFAACSRRARWTACRPTPPAAVASPRSWAPLRVATAYGLEFSTHCGPHVHAPAPPRCPTSATWNGSTTMCASRSMFFDGTLDPTGGTIRPDPSTPGNGLTVRDDVVRRYQVG